MSRGLKISERKRRKRERQAALEDWFDSLSEDDQERLNALAVSGREAERTAFLQQLEAPLWIIERGWPAA